MMHEAVFTLVTADAPLIHAALIPEAEGDPSGRSRGTCTLAGDETVQLSVQATDLSALRAAVNTWLRLIQVATEMSDRAQI